MKTSSTIIFRRKDSKERMARSTNCAPACSFTPRAPPGLASPRLTLWCKNHSEDHLIHALHEAGQPITYGYFVNDGHKRES
jgi:hypothetical protein